MTEDQLEEFFEELSTRIVVTKLRVIKVKQKNIEFSAVLRLYGIQTLERAASIWSRWSKKEREERGFKVDKAQVYQTSDHRDFFIKVRGEIQKEALK